MSLGVALLVFCGQTSPWLAILWFLSLFPFALAAYDRPRSRLRLRPSTAALLLLAAALPVLVRVANMDSDRLWPLRELTARSGG